MITNTRGMKLIYIPPGSFEMGARTNKSNLGPKTGVSKDAPSWDETPRHKVVITRGFYLGQTEVTAAQFRQFRLDFESAPGFAPYASGVSWEDAMAFCR